MTFWRVSSNRRFDQGLRVALSHCCGAVPGKARGGTLLARYNSGPELQRRYAIATDAIPQIPRPQMEAAGV